MTDTQRQGRFITLEGSEGGGKSSLMAEVSRYLVSQGLQVVETREPGGTELGEHVRGLLLDPDMTGIEPRTELGLMFAARVQHVEALIKPALRAGKWVVCDRFTDSTYAYQGGGRGIALDIIKQFEAMFLGEFEPDLTLLLDLPVDIGLKRASAEGVPDRFEQEQAVFFFLFRTAFLIRASQEDRIRVIDAIQSQEKVVEDALGIIRSECFVKNGVLS